MNANIKGIVLQTSVIAAIFALALFVPAGTLAWTAGWVYLVLFISFISSTYVWLLAHNPGLLKERLAGTVRTGQQGWDKVFMVFLQMMCLGRLILISLDAMRFHWSQVPILVQGLGVVILISSFYLIFSTFRENSYLSPVVRFQEDRGHSVVSTGPYHYVRHPMYSGIVLFSIGTPLLLGSWVGLVAAVILIGMIARRAVLEEQMLRQKLQGYVAYAQQVRYRLIPFVW